MQNMIRSMARFSAAMTLFGFQQFQNVLEAFADSADALKIRQSLDAVTDALASELGDETKPAYDSMVRLSNQVVDRTFDTLKKAQPGRKKTEARDSAGEAAGGTSDQGAAAKAEEVELAAD
jgi:hypothetical protein